MKKFLSVFFLAILIVSMTGCSETRYHIRLGNSIGGWVDNTDLLELETTDADAITGATETEWNAGLRIVKPISGIGFETGIDFLSFSQTVNYELPSYDISGTNQTNFSQARIPALIRFGFFRNAIGLPAADFKIGISTGYTYNHQIETRGNLPDPNFNLTDAGPVIGLAFYPFNFSSGRLMFYAEAYRGTKIFEDIYHESTLTGAHSYINIGIGLESQQK